jgi:hypothetical protein
MSDDPVLREELESVIAARRELPAEMEPALAGVLAVCVTLAVIAVVTGRR